LTAGDDLDGLEMRKIPDPPVCSLVTIQTMLSRENLNKASVKFETSEQNHMIQKPFLNGHALLIRSRKLLQ
jgi:hypothetical protein